jgi:hypothetical protein
MPIIVVYLTSSCVNWTTRVLILLIKLLFLNSYQNLFSKKGVSIIVIYDKFKKNTEKKGQCERRNVCKGLKNSNMKDTFITCCTRYFFAHR